MTGVWAPQGRVKRRRVLCWQVKFRFDLTGHTRSVNAVRFSPNGELTVPPVTALVCKRGPGCLNCLCRRSARVCGGRQCRHCLDPAGRAHMVDGRERATPPPAPPVVGWLVAASPRCAPLSTPCVSAAAATRGTSTTSRGLPTRASSSRGQWTARRACGTSGSGEKSPSLKGTRSLCRCARLLQGERGGGWGVAEVPPSMPPPRLQGVAWDPTGTQLVTQSNDRSIRVYTTPAGAALQLQQQALARCVASSRRAPSAQPPSRTHPRRFSSAVARAAAPRPQSASRRTTSSASRT